MPRAIAIENEYWEGQDIWTAYHVVGPDGSSVFQSDVSAVTIYVTDVADPSTVVFSGSLTVANVMKTALTNDGYWTVNDTGYTFLARLTFANHGFEGGHTYMIVYTVTSDTYGLLKIVHRVTVKAVVGA